MYEEGTKKKKEMMKSMMDDGVVRTCLSIVVKACVELAVKAKVSV